MNICTLIGNVTRDPEYTTTSSGTAIARFTIAVQRRFKNKQTGNYDSDFIKCTAFRTTASLVSEYVKKGSRVGITGTLHTDSYEKNGVKIPTCECWVDSIDLYFFSAPKEKKEEPKAEDIFPELDEMFAPADDNELPF